MKACACQWDFDQMAFGSVVFMIGFGVFGAGGPSQGQPLRLAVQDAVHHREVGMIRSDLRRAQGQVVHTSSLRLRWLDPEGCAYAG